MRTATRSLTLLIMISVLGACGARRNADAEPQARTTLRVENQSTLDMNIFVLRGTERIRLGTATAHLTTHLTIPDHLIFGPTPLRFLADPIGSPRTPVSEQITVTAGDEVVLVIPPSTVR